MIQQGNDDIYFCFGANKPIKSPATPQLDDLRFWADKQVCKPILDVEFLHYLCRDPDYEALAYLSSLGVNREKCPNCAWRCLFIYFLFISWRTMNVEVELLAVSAQPYQWLFWFLFAPVQL